MENKENLTKDIEDLIIEETDETSQAVETLKRTIVSDSDIPIDTEYDFKKSGNKKLNLILSVSPIVIAAVILAVGYKSGYAQPKSDIAVENRYSELTQSSSKYNSLLTQISSIGVDIDDLTQERDLKKSEYDALTAYRDGETSIEDELSDMQTRLDELTKSNEKKQEQINSLTANIAEKASTIMNLKPGIYTVGESIIAGKYVVTGSGSVIISSSKGSVKLNSILTAEPISVTLDDGDKIQLDTSAKFTPSN